MKSFKFKWRNSTYAYVFLLVAVIIYSLIATGAFHPPMEIVEDPFYVDTNVERIEINKTYKQGDTIFNIKALEIGDNYSVVLFDSDKGGDIITGLSLYQNGERIEYLSAGSTTSQYKDCAIAFKPIQVVDNIEIRIVHIEKVVTKENIFQIEDNHSDNVEMDVSINGKSGKVRVEFTDENCTLYCLEGMNELLAYSNDGYPLTPGYATLMRDGKEMNEINYSKDNPPNQIKIVTKEIITDGEVVVIPVT